MGVVPIGAETRNRLAYRSLRHYEQQLELGREYMGEYMREYKDTFRALAK